MSHAVVCSPLKKDVRLKCHAPRFQLERKPGLQPVPSSDTINAVSKHKKTLDAIFADPVQSSINWSDIKSLLWHLGAELSEGSSSRVRIALNGMRAVFHRPHPRKEADQGAVRSTRRFLIESGVKP
jgi:hypothetical protein